MVTRCTRCMSIKTEMCLRLIRRWRRRNRLGMLRISRRPKVSSDEVVKRLKEFHAAMRAAADWTEGLDLSKVGCAATGTRGVTIPIFDSLGNAGGLVCRISGGCVATRQIPPPTGAGLVLTPHRRPRLEIAERRFWPLIIRNPRFDGNGFVAGGRRSAT